MSQLHTNLSIAYVAEPLVYIRVIRGYKGLNANDSRALQPQLSISAPVQPPKITVVILHHQSHKCTLI